MGDLFGTVFLTILGISVSLGTLLLIYLKINIKDAVIVFAKVNNVNRFWGSMTIKVQEGEHNRYINLYNIGWRNLYFTNAGAIVHVYKIYTGTKFKYKLVSTYYLFVYLLYAFPLLFLFSALVNQ
jgi:hypothetical protein